MNGRLYPLIFVVVFLRGDVLSIYPSAYLSIYLSISLSIYLSTYIYISIYLSIYLSSIYLSYLSYLSTISIYLPTYLSISINPSINLVIYRSVYLSTISIYRSIDKSIHESVLSILFYAILFYSTLSLGYSILF